MATSTGIDVGNTSRLVRRETSVKVDKRGFGLSVGMMVLSSLASEGLDRI
jgi:hypothetical protein